MKVALKLNIVNLFDFRVDFNLPTSYKVRPNHASIILTKNVQLKI